MMSQKTMKESLQSFAVKKVLHYLDEDPVKSLPKLLEWTDRFDKDNMFAGSAASSAKSWRTPTTIGIG